MSCKTPYILHYIKKDKVLKDGTLGTRTHVIYPSSKEFKGYEYYLDLQKELEQTEWWKNEKRKGHEFGYKLIPCGKCPACRRNQKMQWAIRCELEAKEYPYNHFITLTYDEEHLPIKEYSIDQSNGDIFTNEENWREWKGTLVKQDVIRFMNSYRKWIERDYGHDNLRFFLTGEYGEIGERPHYHILMMNNVPIDLKPIGENPIIKKPYYTNDRIEQIWHKGFINIGEVNWDSISYVTGYCTKKLFGEVADHTYAIKGQDPIFSNMSRNPGIARKYWEEHKNTIYEYDEIITSKGKAIKPPSYFDRLMDIGEADVMENIKEYRKVIAENELKKKMSTTTKTIQEQLLTELRKMKDDEQKYIDRKRNSKVKSL